jgi:hypothetical protein
LSYCTDCLIFSVQKVSTKQSADILQMFSAHLLNPHLTVPLLAFSVIDTKNMSDIESEPLEDGEIHYYPSEKQRGILNMQSLGFSLNAAAPPAPQAPSAQQAPAPRDQEIKVIEVKVENKEEKKKDAANWTANTVLTFGKYRGDTVGNVPVGYLRWLAGYVWNEDRRMFLHQPAKPSFYGNQAFRYFQIHRLCLGCGQLLPPDELRLLHQRCWEKQLLRDGPSPPGGRGAGAQRGRGKYRGAYRSRPY